MNVLCVKDGTDIILPNYLDLLNAMQWNVCNLNIKEGHVRRHSSLIYI